jgi:hypothetical protein
LYGHKAGDLPKHGNISGTINVWCLLPQKQKHLIFFAINHMVNPFLEKSNCWQARKKPCMLPHIWRNAKKVRVKNVTQAHGERSVCCFRKKKICFFVYSHLFPTWLPLCIKVVVGSSEICWHGVQKICIKLIILKTEFEQKTCYTTTLFSIHFMFYIGIL